jgi:hypothetical protein
MLGQTAKDEQKRYFLAVYLNISGLIRGMLPIWQICWKL